MVSSSMGARPRWRSVAFTLRARSVLESINVPSRSKMISCMEGRSLRNLMQKCSYDLILPLAGGERQGGAAGDGLISFIVMFRGRLLPRHEAHQGVCDGLRGCL